MKKIFALAGLMTAAVISLTNCQPKELGTDEPIIGKTFTISASLNADTKTTADGMSTLWAEGDAINLFYGSSYTDLGEVKLVAGEGTKQGTFEASDAPSGSVTWYALYPYSSYVTTPAEHTSGYTYIGDTRGLSQDGFDSTNALCGSACPLYGIAEGAAGEVNISMKHLASAIELNLTNETGSSIVVNSVSVTASEDIIGSYFIAIDSGTPVYTANSVRKTATVNLSDSTLGKGESGKVYLAVRPFTQSESEPFKVTVNYTISGNTTACDVELHPTGNQCVFTAGKMKKVNVSIKAEAGVNVTALNIAEYAKDNNCTISAGTDATMYKVIDLSSAVRMLTTGDDNCGSFWGDYPGTQWRLYQNKSGNVTIKVANGCDLKSVTFTYSQTNGGTLLDSSNNVVASDTAYETSGTSVTFTVGSTTSATNGQVRITGVVVKYTGSGTLGPEQEDNTLEVSPTTVNLPASAGTSTVTVTSNKDGWSLVTTSTDSWLTVTKADGKVNLSATANTGDERSTTFAVKHASDASLTKTVTVTQAAQAAGGTISEITAAGNGKAVSNVVVDWVGAQNFIVKDNTGSMLVRMGSAANLTALGIKKGDKVDVSGNVTTGDNMLRFNNTSANPVTVTKKNTTGNVSNPTTWTSSQLAAAYGVANAAKVTIDATYTGSYTYTVAGTDVVIYVRDSNGVSPETNTAYTLTGYVYGWTLFESTSTKEVIYYIESITPKQTGGDQVVYNKVSKVTSGKTYLFVANNTNGKTYAATNLNSSYTYGRLNGTEVTVSGSSITKTANASIEFVITSSSAGYTIAMSDGRLLGADTEHDGTFQIGDSFGHDFTISFNADGTILVKHVATSKTFYHGGGTYTNFSLITTVPSDGVYPMLFEKAE